MSSYEDKKAFDWMFLLFAVIGAVIGASLMYGFAGIGGALLGVAVGAFVGMFIVWMLIQMVEAWYLFVILGGAALFIFTVIANWGK